jgi:hypothetical protein
MAGESEFEEHFVEALARREERLRLATCGRGLRAA